MEGSEPQMRPIPESLQPYLEQYGLKSFRPGQERVIRTILSGQDTLCVMPTGGGKSLCYQLPALILPGVTLVISPLIALMKDQVDTLQDRNISVTFINSTISSEEQYERMERMVRGEFRLVYVVPERFRSNRFMEAVKASRLSLLAVDEAHCISQWGHDFRPDYARLGYFRQKLGNPPTIALTATATDTVRRDIIELLGLNEPEVFITGFARPNLFYEVAHTSGEQNKKDKLLEFLNDHSGSGIIYTSSRKRTEEVTAFINERSNRRALAYHAGMGNEERKEVQEQFMHPHGRNPAEIVVATTAFGMGVDKADVRFVIHYNMPGSLEGYYQEAGRAGRDGKNSHCLLLFSSADRFIQEYFIESAYPSRDIIKMVYDYLCRQEETPIQKTQNEIREELHLNIGADGIGACEQILETVGVLERMDASENYVSVRIDSELPTLVDVLPSRAKNQRMVLREIERLIGSRRGELVYLSPQQLLDITQMKGSILKSTLRQLNALPFFTYVPPFRGRAIRMIPANQAESDHLSDFIPKYPIFESLKIDFQEHEKRKKAEYDRVDRVIHFAISARCRQMEILEYFGGESSPPCGNCDNCRNLGIYGRPENSSGEINDENTAVNTEDPGKKSEKKESKIQQASGQISIEESTLVRYVNSEVPKRVGAESGDLTQEYPERNNPSGNAVTGEIEVSAEEIHLKQERPAGKKNIGIMTVPKVTEKLIRLVQVILSCLARITQERGFSCGKTLLGQVLVGSHSTQVRKLNLMALKTYGMLKSYTRKEITEMVEILQVIGLIGQQQLREQGVSGFKGLNVVLTLTEKGWNVMRGTVPLGMVPPFLPSILRQLGCYDVDLDESYDSVTIKKNDVESCASMDEKKQAGERLEKNPKNRDNRASRSENDTDSEAELEKGDVFQIQERAAYNLEHEVVPEPKKTTQDNKIAAALARLGVISNESHKEAEEESPRISGERVPDTLFYGEAENIQEKPQSQQVITEDPEAEKAEFLGFPKEWEHDRSEEFSSCENPDFYWTWQLFQRGFRLIECMQIRKQSRQDTLEHLLLAQESGYPVMWKWIFTEERWNQLQKHLHISDNRMDFQSLASDTPGETVLEILLFTRLTG